MTYSKPARLWLDRIATGKMTHPLVNRFCQTIGPLLYGETPRRRTNLTAAEADWIYDEFHRSGGVELDGCPLFAPGVPWREAAQQWIVTTGARQGLPVGMVAAAEAGRLEFGFCDIWREDFVPGWGRYSPVYVAQDHAGETWYYAPTPWQRRAYEARAKKEGRALLWWQDQSQRLH